MKIAKKNIKFLGYQSDQKIKTYMEECRAFVYAGVEDFGIAPVEAMAAGAPIIALGKAGILDISSFISKPKNLSSAKFIFLTIGKIVSK